MGPNTYTLYFRHFPEHMQDEDLKNLFSKYGEIQHFFIHHNRQYGMVEFPDTRCCDQAIESLHEKPPMGMYVNYAKSDRNRERERQRESDSESTSSSNRNSNFNMSNQRSFQPRRQQQHSQNNFDNYDPDDVFYIDRKGKILDILVDDNGTVYVPVDQVTGVRRVVKLTRSAQASDYLQNPQNYKILEDDDPEAGTKNVQQNDNNNFRRQNNRMQNQPQMGERRNFQQNEGRQSRQENDWRNNIDRNRGQRFDQNRSENNDQQMNTPRKQFDRSQRNDRQGGWQDRRPNDNAQMNGTRNIDSSYQRNERFHQKQTKTVEDDEDWLGASSKKEDSQSKPGLATKIEKTVDIPKPSQKYNQISLPLNQEYEVMIFELKNDQIWVQPTSAAEELLPHVMELTNKYGPTSKSLFNPTVGTPCLHIFEDLWCRAVVTNQTPLTIRYVDFGNSEVNPKNLTEISDELLKIPTLAMQIIFKGKKPELKLEESRKVHLLEINNNIYYVKNPGEELTTQENIKKLSKPSVSFAKPPTCPKELMMYGKFVSGVEGVILVAEILAPGKFVGGVICSVFTDEINVLDEVSQRRQNETELNPKVGDTVYALNAKEEYHCRALITEVLQNSYKIAFIDYGTEATVQEVSPLPAQLSKIPWMSCLCIVPSQHANHFTEAPMELSFTVINVSENSAVIQIIKDGNEVCFGQMTVWEPFQKENTDLSKNINKVPKQKKVIELKNGEIISLINEADGFLLVRNKEGQEVLNKIQSNMTNYTKNCQNITSQPSLNQIILAPFQDSFYRATINNIEMDKAQITYIDYANQEILPWKQFKSLPDELETVPETLIKIKLLNHSEMFTRDEQQTLAELCENETKFKVSFENIQDGINLFTKEGKSILDILKPEIKNTPKGLARLLKSKIESKHPEYRIPSENDPIILVTALPLNKIKDSETMIKILEVLNSDDGLITFCINDASQMKKIFVDMSSDFENYVSKLPNVPYRASNEEVVLVKYGNEWRRGIFLGGIDDACDIFCVDHGIQIETNLSNIRRISPDMVKDPALANIGTIVNYSTCFGGKSDEEVHGKIYHVKVVEKNEDNYKLSIC